MTSRSYAGPSSRARSRVERPSSRGSSADALASTVSSVYAVLKATLDSGERELRIIAAQGAIADPAREFEVEQVR